MCLYVFFLEPPYIQNKIVSELSPKHFPVPSCKTKQLYFVPPPCSLQNAATLRMEANITSRRRHTASNLDMSIGLDIN